MANTTDNRPDVEATIEGHSPGEVHVGENLNILVHGRATSRTGTISSVELMVGQEIIRRPFDGIARPDAFRSVRGVQPTDALFCGFAIEWHGRAESAGPLEVSLRFQIRGSGRLVTSDELRVGTIQVAPKRIRVLPKHAPEVAIAMATFNPNPKLFHRQIESLRAQTMSDWALSISDESSDDESRQLIAGLPALDHRIHVQHGARLGFYGNFERALRMIDRRAPYFAFCDQDDSWFPQKLETLVERLGRSRAQLVVGDMRVVDEAENTLSSSFWKWRHRHSGSLKELLIANTVTGAALLARSSLLKFALPFPHYTGTYHDAWMALVAASRGSILFLNEPLQDYVQHSANVLGQNSDDDARAARQFELEAQLVEQAVERTTRTASNSLADVHVARLINVVAAVWPALVQRRFLYNSVQANTGRKRSRQSLIPYGEATLSHAAEKDGEQSNKLYLSIPRWLSAGASAIDSLTRDPTLRQAAAAWAERAVTYDKKEVGLADKILAPAVHLDARRSRKSITLLVPELRSRHVFAGYLAKFHLAQALARSGASVRLALVDQALPNLGELAKIEQLDPSLKGLFTEVDVEEWGGKHEYRLRPNELVIATTWWSALIANKISRDRKPLYLIQEYETITVPTGSWSVMADRSYELPHHALFSTAILRVFFKEKGLGVFSRQARGWLSKEKYYSPPVVKPKSRRSLEEGKHVILCYMRPEHHAARNLYDVLLLALPRLFDSLPRVSKHTWTVIGIGASTAFTLDVGGRTVDVLARTGLDGYQEAIARAQVGVALMHAPHPSMVPMDMAAAGLQVVTSTYESKSADVLRRLSPNIIGVNPEPDAVADAILEAVRRADNTSLRKRSRFTTEWRFDLDWLASLD